jgi:hypothetical protein
VRRLALASVLGCLAAAVGLAIPATAAATPPTYNHVVLAIFENKARSQIIGSNAAPYLNHLAAQGANFTQSFAIRHPSQPNYLDLFSGSNHGLEGATGNNCPQTFASGNLGHQLIAGGRTFVGYAEGLPSAGSPVCSSGGDNGYWRKHAPWTNFTNLDQSRVSLPYSAFPTDFTRLPTVSWVVPNQCNDMHNFTTPGCSISHGDTWAKNHLDAYAQWAKTHNSLLIVTWDEDDGTPTNHIPTFFVGARINPGNYSERIDHYTVLRTIEAMYGLPGIGAAANRSPITNVFAPVPTTTLTLTNVNQTQPRRWRLGGKLATFAAVRRPRVGTTFRFTLNEAATVRFVFDQLLPGRRLRNGKCVAQTARNRTNKACTRSVPRGSLSFNAGAGLHRLFFQGRVTRTRKLQPGTYTLTIAASNAVGQRATKGPLRSFTIVPG